MSDRAFLRLATLGDLARIYSDIDAGVIDTQPDVHNELAPPGCELVAPPVDTGGGPYPDLPYIWGEIHGDFTTLDGGSLYWVTFAEYAAMFVGIDTSVFHTEAVEVAVRIAGFGLGAAAYPIVFVVGRGGTMRWLRSTVRGSLGGGVEQFQFKIDLGKPGDDPDLTGPEMATYAAFLAGLWNTYVTGVTTFYPAGMTLDEVGVCQCTQTDGTDVDGSGGNLETTDTEWYMYPLPAPHGTSSSASLPFEVACAVTTQTDHRGPSGRGRFYLPPFALSGSMSTANAGCYDASFLSAIADPIGTLFDAIITDGTAVPVVVSRRRIILNAITSLNVGVVPDSQRRRRRSQDEARSTFWTA